MAQWITRFPPKEEIVGSSPIKGKEKIAFVAQLAEHAPSKRKVTGSNPVGGY